MTCLLNRQGFIAIIGTISMQPGCHRNIASLKISSRTRIASLGRFTSRQSDYLSHRHNERSNKKCKIYRASFTNLALSAPILYINTSSFRKSFFCISQCYVEISSESLQKRLGSNVTIFRGNSSNVLYFIFIFFFCFKYILIET